ncbi:type II 3-dehydroquinate dehydratase [Halobacteriovorax sp. JY17]|uniref:type II 3-dehydroquinate dehydratase n=1 Tax=Halobacteriovorax sp. JY17 TaxID=2014617 RepID=UPI000C359B6C|nr:type II 3-dehydroquinate dehydratase [Halobacteriovorax sp. JY17]PIK14483.1 MAG: 3-dehydroquinate dehydratase [Halobacteriovorax sp. JY17]
MKKKFMVINGPNLNLLGSREPEIYGAENLKDIEFYTSEKLSEFSLGKVEVDWFQSNIEGEIVEKIQQLIGSDYQSLIINPAAYSHTSIAILDALKMLNIPVVEVHLSNTHLREEYRQQKLTAKSSTIIMEGLGKRAYLFGILSQLIK